MTLDLRPTEDFSQELPRARVMIIGAGGGGGNAVDNMVHEGITGVEFVVANTDAQQLKRSPAPVKIQLGPKLTRGFGAGADPDIGRQATEEVAEELKSRFKDVDMVFIASGMGGGTGTGAASVIARLAREAGALTIGVVSLPFDWEGRRKARIADMGLEALRKEVNTLIVIPNQNLMGIIQPGTSMPSAFKMVDQVLCDGVKCVADIITGSGHMNVDFADVRNVLAVGGKAMMGTGRASKEEDGDDFVQVATEKAIKNPLLAKDSIQGARALVINAVMGEDISLMDFDGAVTHIHSEVDPDANVISGVTYDPKMKGKFEISVVATGLDQEGSFSPMGDHGDTVVIDEAAPMSGSRPKKRSFGGMLSGMFTKAPAEQHHVEEDMAEEHHEVEDEEQVSHSYFSPDRQ